MIRVLGIQKDGQGQENKIELTTEGKVYEKNNNIYIVYEESEISGMEGATTTLKVEGDKKVSMKRFGSSDSQMVFEVGKRHSSEYKTMFGDFKMYIKTHTLEVDLSLESYKGSINVSYDVVIVGMAETENTLEITVL